MVFGYVWLLLHNFVYTTQRRCSTSPNKFASYYRRHKSKQCFE